MQGSIEATSITYSAAILACSVGEQWQVALGLLEQVGNGREDLMTLEVGTFFYAF